MPKLDKKVAKITFSHHFKSVAAYCRAIRSCFGGEMDLIYMQGGVSELVLYK